MPAEENKEICRRFFEELHNRHNLSVIDDLVAADVVSHAPFPGQKPGAQGLKETMALFHRAFPDLSVTTTHLLAEGDKVMGHFTVSGTHRGEFMGQPPTGRKVSYDEVVILRLAGGKIVEHWAVAESLDLMKGIGAIESQSSRDHSPDRPDMRNAKLDRQRAEQYLLLDLPPGEGYERE